MILLNVLERTIHLIDKNQCKKQTDELNFKKRCKIEFVEKEMQFSIILKKKHLARSMKYRLGGIATVF